MSECLVMASVPVWNQIYDHHHQRLPEFDRFLNPGTSSSWDREIGDRGPRANATNSFGLVGEPFDSDQESIRDQSIVSCLEMAKNVSNDIYSNEGVGLGASRPLKSRPEDRIASIMDNPFYKSYGVKHSRFSREESPVLPGAKMPSDTDGRVIVREELGEYKPGSGFVRQLRGRFASLGIQEEPFSLHHIKHASSVDDIVDGTESQTMKDRHTLRDRRRPMTSSFSQHRARSVESLDRNSRKPAGPYQLRSAERKWEHSSSPTKHLRDGHLEAPDVKLARDDIILIENPPKNPPRETDGVEEDGHRVELKGWSFKNDTPADELPKPNTVSSVRSLFESGMPLSPTAIQSVESFCGENESSKSLKDSVNLRRGSRDTVLTTRPSSSVDTTLTQKDPVLSLKDTSILPAESKLLYPQPHIVDTDFSQRIDISKNSPSSSDSKTAEILSITTSSASSTLSAADSVPVAFSTENVKSSVVCGSDNTETRPVPQPRTTATVKAVPASRPAVPSRSSKFNSSSVSNSVVGVPPSFTPSIKKTSPVMPVAPFKDNQQNGENDNNRHLIYTKGNLSSRHVKASRIKDYSELSTVPDVSTAKKLTEEAVKVDSQNDVLKVVTYNHKGRAPPVPNRRQSEESSLQFPSSEVIDIHHSNVLKPINLPSIEDSQLVNIEPSEYDKAPQTLLSKPDTKTTVSESNFGSSSSVSDESELHKDDKEAKNSLESCEPVKGIPSIIANRLKQNAMNQNDEPAQSRPPGELFGVRLGKTRHGNISAEEASEIPTKRLTPAPEKQEKDPGSNLPPEIESHFASVMKKKKPSKNTHSGVSKIFDSSQLKRRDKEAGRSTSLVDVPRLDLSGITSEDSVDTGSYRITSREIIPCNIEFIGANVSIGRSMLAKNRTVKINIRFHEVLFETFEYPSEDAMLDQYLKDHPDEVLSLVEESWPAESSDDADIPETSRGGTEVRLVLQESELLKSNTSLAHSGNLQSYRGKYQEVYELGSVLNKPEKAPEPEAEVEVIDQGSLYLRPADEDDTQTWSTDTSADLLF